MLSWIVSTNERLPDDSPIADGANVATRVALWPPANVNGNDGPESVKPRPDATASVMINGAAPEFLSVRPCLLLEPIATFPKLRFDSLMAKLPDDETQPVRTNPRAKRKNMTKYEPWLPDTLDTFRRERVELGSKLNITQGV